jgi:hypothetical protein
MERERTVESESGVPLLWLIAIFIAAGESAWWFAWHVVI